MIEKILLELRIVQSTIRKVKQQMKAKKIVKESTSIHEGALIGYRHEREALKNLYKTKKGLMRQHQTT